MSRGPKDVANHSVTWAKKYDPKLTGIDLAIEAIECDICDRGGIKHVWRDIDPKIVDEIKETWKEIIILALKVK